MWRRLHSSIMSFRLLWLSTARSAGTTRVGAVFGPIMVLWVVSLGLLGFRGILMSPSVLWSLDPLLGLEFLFRSGGTGFVVLGSVFLAVTGAEALYADVGHF